jgi:hypothetical protein
MVELYIIEIVDDSKSHVACAERRDFALLNACVAIAAVDRLEKWDPPLRSLSSFGPDR